MSVSTFSAAISAMLSASTVTLAGPLSVRASGVAVAAVMTTTGGVSCSVWTAAQILSAAQQRKGGMNETLECQRSGALLQFAGVGYRYVVRKSLSWAWTTHGRFTSL